MTPVRCRLTGHRWALVRLVDPWTITRDALHATVERCRRCGVTRVRYGR